MTLPTPTTGKCKSCPFVVPIDELDAKGRCRRCRHGLDRPIDLKNPPTILAEPDEVMRQLAQTVALAQAAGMEDLAACLVASGDAHLAGFAEKLAIALRAKKVAVQLPDLEAS